MVVRRTRRGETRVLFADDESPDEIARRFRDEDASLEVRRQPIADVWRWRAGRRVMRKRAVFAHRHVAIAAVDRWRLVIGPDGDVGGQSFIDAAQRPQGRVALSIM